VEPNEINMASEESTSNFGSRALDNHQLDWRAIVAGALAQGVVTFVLFVLPVPIEAFVLGVVVSATTAALLSRNYRDEAVDGGVSAALGGAVAVVAVIAGMFFKLGDAPLGLKLDFTVILGVYGTLIAGVTGCLSGVAGAIIAYVVAKYRERWRLRQEFD